MHQFVVFFAEIFYRDLIWRKKSICGNSFSIQPPSFNLTAPQSDSISIQNVIGAGFSEFWENNVPKKPKNGIFGTLRCRELNQKTVITNRFFGPDYPSVHNLSKKYDKISQRALSVFFVPIFALSYVNINISLFGLRRVTFGLTVPLNNPILACRGNNC